jgi:hypothetical protein
MLQIVTRTKSLGRKVEGSDDDWPGTTRPATASPCTSSAAGSSAGTLERPPEPADPAT